MYHTYWSVMGCTPLKFNSSPLINRQSKRKLIFQASFFRGYVKFQGCKFKIYFSVDCQFTVVESLDFRVYEEQPAMGSMDAFPAFRQGTKSTIQLCRGCLIRQNARYKSGLWFIIHVKLLNSQIQNYGINFPDLTFLQNNKKNTG